MAEDAASGSGPDRTMTLVGQTAAQALSLASQSQTLEVALVDKNLPDRTGQRLDWDAAQMKFANAAAANALVQEPYQNGWSLDTI